MYRCTRHVRRSDKPITCGACGEQILPGEQYRRLVVILEEWASEDFEIWTGHEECVADSPWYELTTDRPPIHQPKATIVWTVDSWNARYPVGTAVDYFPIAGLPDCQRTRTRSAAWEICGHVSVKVEGIAGGVSVEHLAVIPLPPSMP